MRLWHVAVMVVGALIFVLGIDLVKEVCLVRPGFWAKLTAVVCRPCGIRDIVSTRWNTSQSGLSPLA